MPFDSTEGLNEEKAALSAGREMIENNRQLKGTRLNIDGYSESGSIDIGSISSDVRMLLDVHPTEDT